MVELQNPEINNGPFLIYYYQNKKWQGKLLYNVYHIELQDQDLRFMIGELEAAAFEAWHIGGNKVFVKVPSVSFDYLKNAKALATSKKQAGYTEPNSLEANSVTQNAIVNNPDRHFKYYLLEFPNEEPEDGLDNSICSPGAENGKIEIDLDTPVCSFEVQTAKGKQTATQYRANIWWDIAATEREPRYVQEAQPKKNELDSKVTQRFNSMAIN